MKNIFTLIFFGLMLHLSVISAPKYLSPSSADFAQLRCNLYIVAPNGSTVLMDGNLTQYDSGFSNNIDAMDARKMTNPSENWGMVRSNNVLVIERRHSIITNDSVFFKMWNMRNLNYQIEIIVNNLNRYGRTGVLEDKYLQTSTPINLNDTTNVRFSVSTDPLSKAADRFRIVFITSSVLGGPLPLTFTYLKAYNQNKAINIDWNTANETNVNNYEVQKSYDAIHFEMASASQAKNAASNAYSWTDFNAGSGDVYYRVHSIDFDGSSKYSQIMKVFAGEEITGITVYPNPVAAGKINLRFMNEPQGLYKVKLVNSFGQVVMAISILHTGNPIETLQAKQNISGGIYRLEIRSSNGDKKVISVLMN